MDSKDLCKLGLIYTVICVTQTYRSVQTCNSIMTVTVLVNSWEEKLVSKCCALCTVQSTMSLMYCLLLLAKVAFVASLLVV